MWTLIGIIAATLTMFSFIPQIIKVFRSKSVRDVSFFTLLQLSSGVFLWIIYGLYLRDIVIIVANTVTLLTLLLLGSFYFKYRKSGVENDKKL